MRRYLGLSWLVLECRSFVSASDDHGVDFDACARWAGDAGVRGRLLPHQDPPGVVLEPCGLRPAEEGILAPLREILLSALGPLDVSSFAAAHGDETRHGYLRIFAEATAASLAQHCGGPGGCSVCPAGRRSAEHAEAAASERALVDGLAAASAAIAGDHASPDHAALAAVTIWLREHEEELEWKAAGTAERAACLREGEAHGYECRTFTYGSTFFPSWLRVMRFPAVASAIQKATSAVGPADRHRGEMVVLGSSLGWQTLWSALALGIRSVGYELLEHRAGAARLAASQSDATESLVQFHAKDALSSDLSRAAVIYLTDLIWEDYLCIRVADHVKKRLEEAEDGGAGVVVVSNKFTSWKKMRFTHLGQISVAVSWMETQAFHFWSVSPTKR